MQSEKIYNKVTAEIIKQLEAGVIPWHQAWKNGGVFPRNLLSDHEYNGTNWLLLSSLGFASPFWATYKQIQKSGGYVKKGGRSMPIIYADSMLIDSETGKTAKPNQKEGDSIQKIHYMKIFNVFNLNQTEEIPSDLIPQIGGFPTKGSRFPHLSNSTSIS